MSSPHPVVRVIGLALALSGALLLAPASSWAAGPTITTTAQSGHFSATSFTQDLYDTAQVTTDGTTPATTGSVRFRLYGPNDATCGGPIDFTSTNPVASGSATSGTTTPPVGGTYQWVADYLAADGTTVLASSPCNSANESTVHSPFPLLTCIATPQLCIQLSTLSTTAQPGTTVQAGSKLSDKAAVTYGFPMGQSPALVGTVTFELYGPDDATCSGAPVYTDTGKPVSSGLASSGEFTPTSAGVYRWVASYSGTGASGFPAATGTCGDPAETTSVTKVTPSLTNSVKDAATDGTWDGTQVSGAKAYDSAVLGGTVTGQTPTGTVTYDLYSAAGCSGSPTSEQVTLAGDGSVPRSATTAALAAGSYSYKASYSGDANYASATSSCAEFAVAETPPGPPPGAACVVPEVDKGASSRVVADKLKAAGCALGHVSKRFSRKVKRGKLIKLKTKAGTELPAGTGVDAVFSKGKRKR